MLQVFFKELRSQDNQRMNITLYRVAVKGKYPLRDMVKSQ